MAHGNNLGVSMGRQANHMANPAASSQEHPIAAAKSRPAPASIFEALVPALIQRGHSLQALCFFFALTVELLLDSIERCGLPTPSDRPYRTYCRASAWTPEQIQQLMICWPTGAYATVIAQRIGRSAGSVRYKAKWLGLPARPRASLRREISEASLLPLMPSAAITAIENDLADTERAAAAPPPAPSPDDAAPAADQTAQRLAEAAAEVLAEQAPEPVAAQAVESVSASEPVDAAHSLPAETSEPAELRPAPDAVPAAPVKPKRRKILHSRDLDKRLGDLWLRGVASDSIGADLGRNGHLVECRARTLGLPGRHFSRGKLKMSCDLNEPHIEPFRSQRWQFSSCMLSGEPLWRTANGPRISKAAKQTKDYQDKVASLDEAEYPVDD
jgi:hypothetical protein